MVKRTQIIHLLLPTNCLSVADHFVALVLHGLTYLTRIFDSNIFTNSKTPTTKFNVSNIFRLWYTLSLEIVSKFHLIFQLIFKQIKLTSVHAWNHQKTRFDVWGSEWGVYKNIRSRHESRSRNKVCSNFLIILLDWY